MSRPRRGKKRPRPAPLRAPEVVTVTKVAQQGDGEALLADGGTRIYAVDVARRYRARAAGCQTW